MEINKQKLKENIINYLLNKANEQQIKIELLKKIVNY